MPTDSIRLILLLMLLASSAPWAKTLPDPQEVRLERLQLMRGFPPPVERQVTRENYLLHYPNARWAFHHMRELLPSRNVSRGTTGSAELPRGEDLRQRLDALSFVGPDGQAWRFTDYLTNTYADATLIMKDGKVIYEAYHQSMAAEQPHMLWSLSKSLVGVTAAQMIEEGLLDPDALVTDYVPELQSSGWQDATLGQLLDMTADVAYSETDLQSDVLLYGFAAGMLPAPADYSGPDDIYSYLPTIAPAGTHGDRFIYRTVHTEVLGWIMRRVSGQPLADLLSERIWRKLGAEHDAYMLLDRQGTEWAGAGFNASLRDLARFGEMMRQNGYFNGQQIIAPEVVSSIRQGADPLAFEASGRDYQPGYSYRAHWWISHDEDGTYEALGAYGQLLHINPTAGIVVVRLSSHPLAPSAHSFPATRLAMAALAEALR